MKIFNKILIGIFGIIIFVGILISPLWALLWFFSPHTSLLIYSAGLFVPAFLLGAYGLGELLSDKS